MNMAMQEGIYGTLHIKLYNLCGLKKKKNLIVIVLPVLHKPNCRSTAENQV